MLTARQGDAAAPGQSAETAGSDLESTRQENVNKFDPISVEVLKNELAAISEEMAITISRSAQSPMIRIGDFAAAVLDEAGVPVGGQGYASPITMCQFTNLMAGVLAKLDGDFAPGDLLIANDPFQGWSHLPDVAVVLPVFWHDTHVGFSIAYSHHTDIGGRFPGGTSSDPTSAYEEGLRLPIVKLESGGRRNDALLEVITANVRAADTWISDLDAKIAGVRRGATELQELLDRHGLDAFKSFRDYSNDRAEAAMREAIAAIGDGTYVVEETFGWSESDAESGVPVKLTLTVTGDQLRVDFTGTGSQVPRAVNCPMSVTRSQVCGTLRLLVDADVPMGTGLLRPIEVVAPAGTLVSATYPGAVGGRSPLSARLRGLVFEVLDQALPNRIPVPSGGVDVLHAIIDNGGRSDLVLMEPLFNGWGARPDKDGIDGVAPIDVAGFGVNPAELVERTFPVVVEKYAYVPDTGGTGRFRGSMSTERTWRFLAPATAMMRTNRLVPQRGFNGGGPGGQSWSRVERADGSVEEVSTVMFWHLEMNAGDRLSHVMGGAGGQGDAYERDVAAVLSDVENDKVSAKGALQHYGVAVTDDSPAQLDEAGTERARARHLQPPDEAVHATASAPGDISVGDR